MVPGIDPDAASPLCSSGLWARESLPPARRWSGERDFRVSIRMKLSRRGLVCRSRRFSPVMARKNFATRKRKRCGNSSEAEPCDHRHGRRDRASPGKCENAARSWEQSCVSKQTRKRFSAGFPGARPVPCLQTEDPRATLAELLRARDAALPRGGGRSSGHVAPDARRSGRRDPEEH